MANMTTHRDKALSPTARAGFGLVVAIATGVVFGLAFQNVAIGIVSGLIFGGAGGAGLGKMASSFRRRSDDGDNSVA